MSENKKYELIGWVKQLIMALVISIILINIILPVKVDGQSMYPTLEDGEHLFVNKLIYNYQTPNRGDIVIFNSGIVDSESSKEKLFVKRIIAIEGDHISIKDNKVYINNEPLNEEYLNGIETYGDIDVIVPNGCVFTMGDNRGCSKDSRDEEVGMILFEDIIGKVSVRVYPFNRAGNIK